MDPADRLAWEVEILELEIAVALLAAGIPYGARREPFPHEVRAPINLATIKQRLDSSSSDIGGWLQAARQTVLVALLAWLLAGYPSPADVMKRLDDLAAGSLQIPADVQQLLDKLEAQIGERLDIVAEAAYGDTRTEAAQLGIDLRPGDVEQGKLLAMHTTVQLQARRTTTSMWLALLGVLRAAASRVPIAPGLTVDQLGEQLRAGADAASLAGLMDTARQATAATQGAARTDGLRVWQAPSGQRIVAYASELLDDRTCDPCQNIDGQQYESMDDALADYSGGQYVWCDGGPRCRGQLVVLTVAEDNSIGV